MKKVILEKFEEELRSGKNPTVKEYEKEFGPLDRETKEAMATVKMAYLCRDDFRAPWLKKETREEKEEASEFNAASIFSRVARNRSFAMAGSTIPFDLMKNSGTGIMDIPEKEAAEIDRASQERHLHFHLAQNITPKEELKKIEKRLKGRMKKETLVMMEFMLDCIKPVQRFIKYELNKLLKQAREVYIKKDYNEALSLYTDAINLDPNSDDAWTGLGVTLRRQGKFEEALNYLGKATGLNSHNDKAWSNRGIALCELKRYEESLQFYDRAIKENPKNYWAYFGKANALMELNKTDDALYCYKMTAGINPDYTQAWIWVAFLLLDKKQYEESLKAFEKAIKDYSGIGWYGKAIILKTLKRQNESRDAYERALQEYEKLLIKDPNATGLLRSKADILKELGKEEESKQCFQKIEELKKNREANKK